MILQCPECQTRYAVPDIAVGLDGRKVRCTRCKHQWYVVAELDASLLQDFPINEELPPPNHPVPSVHVKPLGWPFKAALAAMAVIAAGLVIFTQMKLPVPSGQGVILSDIHRTLHTSKEGDAYSEISCIMVNTAQEPYPVPNIGLRMLSASGKVLAEDMSFMGDATGMLAPEEQRPCPPMQIPHRFSTAKWLVLEIGTPSSLSWREDWTPPEESDFAMRLPASLEAPAHDRAH